MALINPSGLYTLGNVKLDSTPTTQLYGHLLQRKKAKEEAIDEYYQKLPTTLNAAGMRDQDREGFDQAINLWRLHYQQNKDKIRKGGNKEAFDNEQLFRQLQTRVDQSKNAAKTDLQLGKMRFEKENGYIFDDPDFIETQSKHTLPIWDEKHKAMDLGTVAIPPEPFDDDKQNKLWTVSTKGLTPGKQYDYTKSYENPKTGQVVVPFQKTYSPEQITNIAGKAANLVSQDKSAKAYYTKLINTPNKEEWEELQNAYVKYFPNDIVDTPEKAAAADAIIRATVPQETGEEQEINYRQRQDDKRINISLNMGGGSSTTTPTVQGNEFDRLPKILGIGEGVTGTSKAPMSSIPEAMKAILKTAGIDIEGAQYFDVDVKDGEIQSITPYFKYVDKKDKERIEKAGIITRTDMENAQLKYNAEPQKSTQPTFGDKGKTATTKKMVTMVLPDGRKGQIPEDQVAQFLKDNPKAKKQ